MSDLFGKESEGRFLDRLDDLNGAISTLEHRNDAYIDALSEVLADGKRAYRLEDSIDYVSRAIEDVFEQQKRLDNSIKSSEKRAMIDTGQNKCSLDLEEYIQHVSNGIYTEINSLDNLTTLIGYLKYEDNFEPDTSYLGVKEDYSDATAMISNPMLVLETEERLETEYTRLAYTEHIIVEEMESKEIITQEVVPPIMSVLTDTNHISGARELSKRFEKLF